MLHMSHQAALGFEYLQTMKFVHRDLACRNVLVDLDFAVKIGDFGEPLYRPFLHVMLDLQCLQAWHEVCTTRSIISSHPRILMAGRYQFGLKKRNRVKILERLIKCLDAGGWHQSRTLTPHGT